MTYPKLPGWTQQDCVELRYSQPVYDAAHGGQYRRGTPIEIPFRGAILPLSEKDLQYAPQGTTARDSRKLYTEHALLLSSEVRSGGEQYSVTGELSYGGLHPLRRYILKRKEAIAYDSD